MAHDFADRSSYASKRERFDVRLEADHTWTVYDIFSGLPVLLGCVAMTKLGVDAAFYAVDELNDQDLRRRLTLGF